MVIYITVFIRDLEVMLVVVIYVTVVRSETWGVKNPGFGVKKIDVGTNFSKSLSV